MDRAHKEDVGKAFWERQRQASSPAVVSAEWNAISKAQFEVWTDFAATLDQGARVLDLATGSGKLPLMLRKTRPDLTITGIDIAEPLPPAPEGITLMGGVRMDQMPFEDASFDVVVSQFGYEYGQPLDVGRELLRVLQPDGRIGLMVHRGDGPILAHNRKREEQIRWVKEDRRLFEEVRALIPTGAVRADDARQLADAIAAEGRDKFGPGSVAWELAAAVGQTLELAPRGTHQKLTDTLAFIDRESENELGRITSLAEAFAAADDRASLPQPFHEMNREVIGEGQVSLPDEPPFADLIVL